MLYNNEVNEICEVARRAVHQEMADIQNKIAHEAGTYNWLLARGGVTFFSHHLVPGCQVLQPIPHF